MTFARLLLGTIAIALLGGCGLLGRNKDTSEPPAELVSFDQSLEIRRVWSSKVGRGTERLRLGLRPASDGARIYAGSHDGEVMALDAATGRRVWATRTRLAFSAGPAYGDGLLAFGTTDGELVLLDAQTGEQRWVQPVGSEVLAPPVIARGVVVLRTIDGRLRGFSVTNGSNLWSVEQSRPALTLRGNTAPRIAGTAVVAGFDNGRVGAYDIASGDALWEVAIATPSGVSELERLVDVSAGLQVVGNDVYVAGYQGRAVGIDLTSGAVVWQQELSSYAGLGVDLNNVYVTDDVGAVVALDRRGGAQVWRQEALRLRDVTAPTRFASALVVGDFEGYLHWLDPTSGDFLARQKAASARITGAPLVVGETVYVQGDDGTVAAFALRETERDRDA